MGKFLDRANERVAAERAQMPAVALIGLVISLPAIIGFGWSTVLLLALVAGGAWLAFTHSWSRRLEDAARADQWAEEAEAATRGRRDARWRELGLTR